jgi:hypothetical protein
MTWLGPPPPSMMERARDDLARRAEAQYPGWSLSHGLYGWTAIRARDGLTRRSSSLPGLRPLISTADSSTRDRRGPGPAGACFAGGNCQFKSTV